MKAKPWPPLTFDDAVLNGLRKPRKRKARRPSVTRAEFVAWLVRGVRP